MQRVLVMGSSGAGKSTFARRLSAIANIPMISLDALFWKPGWAKPETDEFRRRVTEAARRPRWIMDGDYIHSAGELRRQRSDTVIWFDLPRLACMLSIFRRIRDSYGQVRPEMAEGCPEKIDFEFFHYVWTYRERQRPKLLEFFEGLRDEQSLVCFKDRMQAELYLQNQTPVSIATQASVH